MTAEEILAIPLSQPLLLFKTNKVFRHEQFRELAKKWHPDISGRNDVMAHIDAVASSWGKGGTDLVVAEAIAGLPAAPGGHAAGPVAL